MYVKGLFTVYRTLQKLGIKPKDILGMGGDVVKMGKSLFNTRVNPKLLKFIEKNGKIPTKILENIKIHARTLKNASENQKNLFQANIKDILNAKMPKPPVTSVLKPVKSVKKPVTSDQGLAIIKKFARKEKLKENLKKGDNTLPTELASESHAGSIAGRVQDVTGKPVSEMGKFIKSEKQLSKILKDWDIWNAQTKAARLEATYPTIKNTEKVIEKVRDFKGWTPTVIKGGKDKLATGGRAGFDSGGDTTEKSWFNIIPQYDEHGNLIPTFSKTGAQQIHGAPEGITSDKEYINFVMSLDIPIDEKISLLGDLAYGKGREKIEYKGDEIALGEGGGKSRKVGIGYNEEGEGFGGHVKYDVDSEEPEAYFKWSKTFAKGGIANHFRKK